MRDLNFAGADKEQSKRKILFRIYRVEMGKVVKCIGADKAWKLRVLYRICSMLPSYGSMKCFAFRNGKLCALQT